MWVMQLENRRLFDRLERNAKVGEKVTDILAEEMVYTYVDKDHYAANTVNGSILLA